MNPKNPNSFWKTGKYLIEDQCSIPALIHQDTTVQTDLGKADLLNSFSSPAIICHTHLWIHLNITIYNHLMGVLRSLCVMRRKSTSYCPPWMSPMLIAPMGFPLESLECWNTLLPSLLQLLNSLVRLYTGHVPSEWKQSPVVPIPKSANNKDLPNNYRDLISCWKDMHK